MDVLMAICVDAAVDADKAEAVLDAEYEEWLDMLDELSVYRTPTEPTGLPWPTK